MKELEILSKGNTKNKLTITPTRVTVKLKDNLTECMQVRILAFVAKISPAPPIFRMTMKIKDKTLNKQIDVCSKECPNRKCYWPREDPGTFNQGQGYRFRSNDWLCGTREIKGCPEEFD